MWGTILRMLLGDLGPLLRVIITAIGDQHLFDHILELASAEGAKLEGQPGDGGAKRQAAFDAIVAALKAAGKVVIPLLINLAIEIALAALRAQTGTLAVPKKAA